MLRWDDIRLLLAVASQGSYARAAQQEGVSLATVGRRLRALEHSLGATLIERRSDGHRLTPQAEALLPAASRMAAAASDLHASVEPGHAEIRILAREWEALFLIRCLRKLRAALPNIELLIGYKHWPDLGRWEAELVLTDHVPSDGPVIARKLGRMAFAVYASHGFMQQAGVQQAGQVLTEDHYHKHTWVRFTPAHRYFASEQWLTRRGLDAVPAAHRFDSGFMILEAVRDGVGLGLLPVWLGEPDPSLRRVSGVLPDLTHETGYLMNAELRHEPRLRAVAEEISALFRRERASLLGAAIRPAADP
ncbi:LysR family transcriptional regulator [Rhodopila sp.]|uniref:LysR family transcriptional regulator n=1 Tax=Rhodopila sp. TaxID=2480087 RepID=UPI003D0E3343